ncbi:uncharacterized protein BDR25DRAFT_346241 [Lindgomyces ingoldianus]|uniref:Uncharacterized protein n=1 Tax=Lindgomyces ingoldianus TaxID=673940 RepID=A0ACB6QET9_9PLEO|nr:uncharacterized protein BDR25DRAFT_346241 [Lindgomyces ingoldianus]KAF2465375.1 hypothetical protein BDR25DRAFT_346241 [Lindgomyces ingoldianus]
MVKKEMSFSTSNEDLTSEIKKISVEDERPHHSQKEQDDFHPKKLRHSATQVSEFTLVGKDLEAAKPSRSPTELPSINKPGSWRIWTSPITKIILVSCIVALPMIVFSIVILVLTFGYRMGKITCPYPELCPAMNQTSSTHYYVDYSATQLVFIASWSSTISLSLISMLMFLFSFTVAQHILRWSGGEDVKPSELPTPYQLSLLIKVLNGELLALWDVFLYKFPSWCIPARRRRGQRTSTAPIVYMAIGVLLLGLAASAFVQATDTWLHIDTQTVEIINIKAEPAAGGNQYSRGLGPWCVDKPTVNNICNKNFWGCGIDCWKEFGATNMQQSNQSAVHKILVGRSADHEIFNFTDKSGLTYAILGPADIPDTIDWAAASFATTTQCRAVLPRNCDVQPPSVDDLTGGIQFNCTKERAGVDVSGNITHATAQIHYVDAHRLFNDSPAFIGRVDDSDTPGFKDAKKLAPNLTEQSEVFNNPWHWQGVLPIIDAHDSLFQSEDQRLWNRSWIGVPLMVLDCDTTVWEVTYTMVNSGVRTITATKSNVSVAGIGSMPAFPAFGLLDSELPEVIYDANDRTFTLETMIAGYTFGMSRSFLAHIGGQSSPRQALKTQVRVPKLITKVSKAALWTLVVSNLVYAAVGIILAVYAIRARSEDVFGFRARLTVGGLAAQIFEKPFADKKADDEWELFRESEGLMSSRVGAEKTAVGGTTFWIKGERRVGRNSRKIEK